MNRHQMGVALDRALVITGIAIFVVWTAHGDLTTKVPGGQALVLGLLAATGALLTAAWVGIRTSRGQARDWIVANRVPLTIALLCVLAAAPRVIVLRGAASYPELEAQALAEARRMLTTGEFRPTTFARPSLLLYAQTAAGSVLFIAGVSVDRWRDVNAVQPADLVQVARLLNLGLALATAALLAVVGGRHRANAGYFAALLFALSPLAWTATGSATEDALATLAALAAWWGISCLTALDAESAARLRALVRAGFFVGLAAGIRPSLVLFTIPLIVTVSRRPHRPPWQWGVLLVALTAGFMLAIPYAVAALPTLLDAGGAALNQYYLRANSFTPASAATQLSRVANLLGRRDGPLVLAASLGLLSWATSRLATARRQSWQLLPNTGLLLGFLLPAGVLFSLQIDLSPRLLLPLEPFLALLGGQFLVSAWDTFRATRRRRRRRGETPANRSFAQP